MTAKAAANGGDAMMAPADGEGSGGSGGNGGGGGGGGTGALLVGAVEHVKGGVAQLEGALSALVAAAAAEREALARERAQLDEERRALEAEYGRVRHALSDSEQVTLNVGGARFTTTVSTLRAAPPPSLFAAMFSGRHALRRDARDGSVFIDRDGRHFADVLNFLRTGQLAYPPDGTDFKYLLDLRQEAEFYGLPGLVAAVDRYPHSVVAAPRAGRVDGAARWAYDPDDPAIIDALAFTVDRRCQLLGVGLCGTPGGYSAEVSVTAVDAAAIPSLDRGEALEPLAVLGGGARTVTAADGEVARLDLVEPVDLEPGAAYSVELRARGSESFSCEDCVADIAAGGVRVKILAYESGNGTTEAHGQFPCLFIRPLAA